MPDQTVIMIIFQDDKTFNIRGDLPSILFVFEAMTTGGVHEEYVNFQFGGQQYDAAGFMQLLKSMKRQS